MARPRADHGFSIAQLEKILSDRKSERSKLEKQRGKLEKELSALNARISALGGVGRAVGGGTRARNEQSLNEVIFGVLKKGGSAMKVGDILKGVEAAGYRSNSANFRGIINQALIKDKRFAKGDVRGSYLLKK